MATKAQSLKQVGLVYGIEAIGVKYFCEKFEIPMEERKLPKGGTYFVLNQMASDLFAVKYHEYKKQEEKVEQLISVGYEDQPSNEMLEAERIERATNDMEDSEEYEERVKGFYQQTSENIDEILDPEAPQTEINPKQEQSSSSPKSGKIEEEVAKFATQILDDMLTESGSTVSEGKAILLDMYNEMQSGLAAFRPDIHHSYRTILSLWTCASWTMDAYQSFPLLWFTALSESGKSKLAKFVGKYANLEHVTDVSVAAIFRSDEKRFILDELEEMPKPLLKLLNTAYEASGTIKRAKGGGDENSVQVFRPYGAYILAGVKNDLPATLRSRCFTVNVPIINLKKFPEMADIDVVEVLDRHVSGVSWLNAKAIFLNQSVRECYLDKRVKRGTLRQLEIMRPLFAMALWLGVLDTPEVKSSFQFESESKQGADSYTEEQIATLNFLFKLDTEDSIWLSPSALAVHLGLDASQAKQVIRVLKGLSFAPFSEELGNKKRTAAGFQVLIDKTILRTHRDRLVEENEYA